MSPRFRESSDQSLLVYFGDRITREAHEAVVKLLRLLESRPIAGVRNSHPAYCSMLVKFDPLKLTHEQLQAALENYIEQFEQVELPQPREVEIPVCYGGEFGPDLGGVAAMHGLKEADLVELHASATYLVYFLGFVPGFAYLGGLTDALATPRLDTPRKSVPKGSVGIAGNQTGIYPFSTPGGWRLIGRTPLSIFRQDRADMSLISIGDHVRFAPISIEKYESLERGCA